MKCLDEPAIAHELCHSWQWDSSARLNSRLQRLQILWTFASCLGRACCQTLPVRSYKKKSSCICAYKITIRAQGTSSIDALLQFAIFLQKLDLYCFFCAGVLSSVKGFFLGVLPGELKNFRTALETGVLQFFEVRKNQICIVSSVLVSSVQ